MDRFADAPDRVRQHPGNPRRLAQRGLVLLLAGLFAGIALITLANAAPSLADSAEIRSDPPVSTSPTERTKHGPADAAGTDTLSIDDPPLTRAATQRRIDEMSPVLWLAQFGRVTIDPRQWRTAGRGCVYDHAAMEASPTLLTLVRHGQTSANIDGVWHGSTNTPLTEHGHDQASAVAAFIEANYQPVCSVYASPLDRAHQTAERIAGRLGLVPQLDSGLREYDLGDWEGMSFDTLYHDKKLFDNMRADPDYRPHGGESPKQVGDRLVESLRRIVARHPGERVVVVSHGGALSIAFGILLDDDYSSWNRMMKNCAISELVLDPQPELVSFNRTEHLPPGED